MLTGYRMCFVNETVRQHVSGLEAATKPLQTSERMKHSEKSGVSGETAEKRQQSADTALSVRQVSRRLCRLESWQAFLLRDTG